MIILFRVVIRGYLDTWFDIFKQTIDHQPYSSQPQLHVSYRYATINWVTIMIGSPSTRTKNRTAVALLFLVVVARKETSQQQSGIMMNLHSRGILKKPILDRTKSSRSRLLSVLIMKGFSSFSSAITSLTLTERVLSNIRLNLFLTLYMVHHMILHILHEPIFR